MSKSTNPNPKVVPAQVSFLAIYNPKLSVGDEDELDQIVFCFSRKQVHDVHRASPVADRRFSEEDVHTREENEQLRQIGLAQGMVEFAKNFSNGAPVDSIDTDKSRIILHELEPDWWVLASIDLTRLPAEKISSPPSGTTAKRDVEYSSREVTPAQLLIRQILKAHSMFLLHHSPNLANLWQRLDRERFCGLLDKFWRRFVRTWDVLLHGNPAVDVLDVMKLAGGGELGVGVGEEEYGSGEREVLEGFVERTDGLVELLVGRYGDPPPSDTKDVNGSRHLEKRLEPWLGRGNDVRASDGIIFSGTGSISKKSRTTISLWMQEIFRRGEAAYGVQDNPSSRPRYKSKASRDAVPKPAPAQPRDVHPRAKSPRGRAADLRRKAIENSATPPGIPPPLIGAVERSLEQATIKAKSREASRSPRQEKSQDEAMKGDSSTTDGKASMFDADKMMKFLTLGYGTSWTMNPKGLPPEDGDTTPPQQEDMASEPPLQILDPTPDVSDDEAPFIQRLEQSIGRFLVGLSGDLENTEFEEDDEDLSEEEPARGGRRLFLRTLTIGRERFRKQSLVGSTNSRASRRSVSSVQDLKTSAAASVDGPSPMTGVEKMQVAVYVHQPFIFVFLFELHTPSLTMPSFYRNIHHQLGPLQKPLLRSTDPIRVAERVAHVLGEEGRLSQAGKPEDTIYDLIYDPIKQTVRTSIPNIPLPGSLAAEGIQLRPPRITVSGSWYTLGIPIGTSTSATSKGPSNNHVRGKWTRIDALNVHAQILNMRSGVHLGAERERTVKTGRGWWILWTTVPNRWGEVSRDVIEAYLVRKSVDEEAPAPSKETKSVDTGRWLLREQRRESGGNGTGGAGGDGKAKGSKAVAEGIGVDARKWIDGLIKLSQ